jgi:hypothetical protein
VAGIVISTVLLGACGKDVPERSADALCARLYNDRMLDRGIGQYPETHEEWLDWAKTFEELAANAPPEIRDALETMAKRVAEVAETADSSVDEHKRYDDPAYEPAHDEFQLWESENCP